MVNSQSDNLIIWRRSESTVHLGARCGECQGLGRFFHNSIDSDDCRHCHGRGWFGIDPKLPIAAQPGSVAKVAMLTVRYAAGIALFNRLDEPDSYRRPEEDDEETGFVPAAMAETAKLARKKRSTHDNESVYGSLVP